MIRLRLNRKDYNDKQTLGVMDIYVNGIFKFALATLERGWNNNEVNNSCIPKGIYNISHYSSPKYPNVLEINNVPNRTNILIHNGNYYNHTSGCILIGLVHNDINYDGLNDVVKSRDSLDKLMDIVSEETDIKIQIT